MFEVMENEVGRIEDKEGSLISQLWSGKIGAYVHSGPEYLSSMAALSPEIVALSWLPVHRPLNLL